MFCILRRRSTHGIRMSGCTSYAEEGTAGAEADDMVMADEDQDTPAFATGGTVADLHIGATASTDRDGGMDPPGDPIPDPTGEDTTLLIPTTEGIRTPDTENRP